MKAYFKYLSYVLRHKWFVFVECCKVGIPLRGLLHDTSKFYPSEFIPYARHFYGNYPRFAEMPAGMKERYFGITQEKVGRDFDKAWLLHQKRNPHHWQFWLLPEDDGATKVLFMPHKYRKEMITDWRGAGRAIKGKDDTAAWYEANKAKMQLHPETRAWIENVLYPRPGR